MDTIDIWWIPLEAPGAPAGPPERWLSPSERRRAERFRFARDRRRFTHTHAALRLLLADRLGVEPLQLEFRTRPGGKPELVPGPAGRWPRFNLSHSDDLALIAVSDRRELGVDLERIRELPDRDELVETVMTPAERAAFARLPASCRTRAFFTCWTRKEAHLKATGDGLFRDPRGIHAGIESRAMPEPIGSESDEHWTLLPLEAPSGYAAALVVEGAGAGVRSRRRRLPAIDDLQRTRKHHDG